MEKTQRNMPYARLLIAGRNEQVTNIAFRAAASALCEGTKREYIWRRESGCDIGEVDLELPSSFPVFVLAPEGLELSPIEVHKTCLTGLGILVLPWSEEGDLRMAKPRNMLCAGILRFPIASMRRAILFSTEDRFKDPSYQRLLVKAVAEALVGAVKSDDYARSVLFYRELLQSKPAETAPKGETAAAV